MSECLTYLIAISTCIKVLYLNLKMYRHVPKLDTEWEKFFDLLPVVVFPGLWSVNDPMKMTR